MSTEFIYFDIGNVLLSFCHEAMCRQMAAVAGIEPKRVADFFFGSRTSQEMLVGFESGHVHPDEFYTAFCEMAGCKPNRAALQLAAADIFEPIAPMMGLVKKLAATEIRLGLLSNTNALHWDFFTDGRYPVLASPGEPESPFEVPIASHLARASKPEPAIYQYAIKRAGVDAHRIMFVDDRPDNVAGARTAGIDAVLFTGYENLMDELTCRGLS